jgi:hypothetical protein
VLANTLLVIVAATFAEYAQETGLARRVGSDRRKLALALVAAVDRARVLVVAVVVVVLVGTLARLALERARLAKLPPAVFVFLARFLATAGVDENDEQRK